MNGASRAETFLSAARRALAADSPGAALRALLDDTAKALHAGSERWLEHDGDELLVAATPDLTVYHITLTPRIHYPPGPKRD